MSKPWRTISVSMKPKCATLAEAPVTLSSERSARPSASTPALLAAYGAANMPFIQA